MIFFVGNGGTVIKGLPSPVYQGSANANTVYLIAPFASNTQVTLAFKLPNGTVTEPAAMTAQGALEGVKNEQTGQTYAGWIYDLPNAVTALYGVVTVQFFFHNAEGKVTASSSVSFNVGQGVPPVLPDAPSDDVYEQILANIGAMQEQLNNGFYAARAIYAWNSTYTYGAGEITFYPDIGNYGAFVKSVVANNTGNTPYTDGAINSAFWSEVVNFNTVTDDFFAEIKEAQAAAEAAEAGAESAQNAAEAAQTAAETAQGKAETAQSAAETAQGKAETAQAAAEAAQTAAETAEGNAKTSETNAASSASAAAGSATSASGSASEAATSAQNAQSSASAAAGSATAAQSAQTAAETAETNAAGSASAAATSAGQAAQSATDASASASQADSARIAAESAKTAAQTAQSGAQTAETNAGTYAGNASGSASAAAQSATQAQAYMEQAKQYAQKEYQIYDSFDELPVPGDSAYIYLVPVSGGSGNDSYSEYLWITETGKYEFIGNLNDVDLSNYAQVNGTYPNMTVGNATNATNATNAANAENATSAASATKATQDGSGNNIASTYATKTELTEGLAGKQPTGNYALQTGTYAGMTVGNATNAENAEHATSADSATNATNANHAASADSATDAQAAAQADKLAAARTMQVNLASSNAAEFDGTENVTPGVTGILPVANGGTGASSLANVTVGNATNAQAATQAERDFDGNIIPDTYAKQNGSYQNLNVGYAMTAEIATQSTQDSLGNNIFDTYMGHWALNKTKDGTKQKDFNNYTEAGFYELFAGSDDSWSNFPISNDNPSSINGNWFLLVLKRSDDYITQIAVSVRGDTAIAIRNCSGGTWGSWRIISQYIGGARKTLGLENVSSGTFTFYNQKTYTIHKDSNVSDWWFRIGMSGNIVTVGIQFNPSIQLTKGTRYRLAYGLPTNQQNESGFWAMTDDSGDAQGDLEIDTSGNLYFTSHNYNITTSTYLNGGAMYITGDVV